MARIAFLGIALILVLASAVPPTVAAQPALPATMYSQAQVDQAGTVIRFDLDPGQAGGQQAITVAPGAMVSGLMEWQAWGANPGEIGQVTLVYSWGGLPVTAYTCIFDGGIGVYPGQHRTDSFSFTAPAASVNVTPVTRGTALPAPSISTSGGPVGAA